MFLSLPLYPVACMKIVFGLDSAARTILSMNPNDVPNTISCFLESFLKTLSLSDSATESHVSGSTSLFHRDLHFILVCRRLSHWLHPLSTVVRPVSAHTTFWADGMAGKPIGRTTPRGLAWWRDAVSIVQRKTMYSSRAPASRATRACGIAGRSRWTAASTRRWDERSRTETGKDASCFVPLGKMFGGLGG